MREARLRPRCGGASEAFLPQPLLLQNNLTTSLQRRGLPYLATRARSHVTDSAWSNSQAAYQFQNMDVPGRSDFGWRLLLTDWQDVEYRT